MHSIIYSEIAQPIALQQHYNQQIPYEPRPDPHPSPALQQQHIDNFQSLSQSLENLKNYVKQALPPPNKKHNPNKTQIDSAFSQPVRGIKHLTLDYQERNTVVKRIRNVTIGNELDDGMRKLLKTMNTDTNAKVANKLQGMYLIYKIVSKLTNVHKVDYMRDCHLPDHPKVIFLTNA